MRVAVGIGLHQDGAAGQPIAAGAPDFLVVGLHAAGQRSVNHRADVGLVDAHAEGDGRDHHRDAALQKLLLHVLATLGVETGVISRGGEMLAEAGGELGGLRASGCVDDGGPAVFVLQQLAGERGALRWRDLDHFDRQVVAPETVNEARHAGQPQLFGDIVLYQRREAGLNREILRSGWGLLVRRLEDKAPGRVEKVKPHYTSQRCSACGQVDAESRESQARFVCTACGYACNGDVNAARNVAPGHAVTARGGDGVARPMQPRTSPAAPTGVVAGIPRL